MNLQAIDAVMTGSWQSWWRQTSSLVREILASAGHGDLPAWRVALAQLPPMGASNWVVENGVITLQSPGLGSKQHDKPLQDSLKSLIPWRKGPFRFFDVLVDSEWRCDQKWARLSGKIAPLTGRKVLDVGSGNGYYGYRMIDEGAECVIGIDPSWLYHCQFLALQHYLSQVPNVVLPLGIDQLPQASPGFDTVFSMGVLYHRRSPLDHLRQLRSFLKRNGELVLETLVIEGDAQAVLVPEDRYACMRNVWFIPSVEALKLWLRRSGFTDIKLLDLTATTAEEQRTTAWKPGDSLIDFLDPQTRSLTIEGYPAPLRSIVRATPD